MTTGTAVKLRVAVTPSRWIAVEGEGAVASIVAKELEDSEGQAPEGPPLFTFRVTEEPAPPSEGPAFGTVRAVSGAVVWRFDRMDYDLAIASNSPLSVTMHIGRRGPPFHIPTPLFPMLERTAVSWAEARAYHAVLLLEYLALVTGDVGVLHASAVERDGRILVLTSAGGVGKTTSACRLVQRAGFRHMADDVLLVDQSGEARNSRRKLMVYPYNARDMPTLEASVRRQGTLSSRWLWDIDRLLRLDRRRRRIHARDLFGDRVAAQGKVDAVVLLRRAQTPNLRIQEVTAESLATRANEIIVNEFGSFMDPLRSSTALLGEAFPWSPGHLASRNVQILTQAFSGASLLCIGDLGPRFDPTDSLAALMAP